jgi:hypothetical protein
MALQLNLIAVAAAAALVLAFPASALAQDPAAVSTSELSGLHGVFGEHVRDLNGDDAGRLWDILVDDAAKPMAAVIDYGGPSASASARWPPGARSSSSCPTQRRRSIWH